MSELLAACAGAVAGALATTALDTLGRARGWIGQRTKPLQVHVERDPAVIWAGAPPWVGVGYVDDRAALPPAPPGPNCPAWWQWAQGQNMHDADLTELQVTIAARFSSTVVVDALRAQVVERQPSRGRLLQCPVGGADLSVRGVEIDLDTFEPPTTTFMDSSGEATGSIALVLTPGSVERFHIRARARTDLVRWYAELLLLVDGRRQVVPIGDRDRPFVTVGSSELPAFVWDGTGWSGG